MALKYVPSPKKNINTTKDVEIKSEVRTSDPTLNTDLETVMDIKNVNEIYYNEAQIWGNYVA
jgi:hypothetical protein